MEPPSDRRDFLRLGKTLGALTWSGHFISSLARPQPSGASESQPERLARSLRQWEQILLPGTNLVTVFPSFRTLKQWADTPVPPKQPFVTLKFEGHPIYALKFADLETQDLAGDRLSVFAEIRKGVVLPDAGLRKTLQGVSAGKDFRMATVAAFFTAAARQNASINVLEKHLLSTLTQSKLLVSQSGGFTTSQTDAVLISIAVPRPDILEHEFNHAVYFIEEPYRKACTALWNSLEAGDRGVFESLMIAYGFPYNFSEDRDLAVREFVAFFRATGVLFNSYLPAIGNAVAASKPGDALYRLRPCFGPDWRLTNEWQNRVMGVGGRLKELEGRSEIYRFLNAAAPGR